MELERSNLRPMKACARTHARACVWCKKNQKKKIDEKIKKKIFHQRACARQNFFLAKRNQKKKKFSIFDQKIKKKKITKKMF